MKTYKKLLLVYLVLISTSIFSFFYDGYPSGALSGAALGGAFGGGKGAAIGAGVGAFSDIMGAAARRGDRYYYDDYDPYYDGRYAPRRPYYGGYYRGRY